MRFRETLELHHPIDRVKTAYGERDFFLDRYRELGFYDLELRDESGDGAHDYRIVFDANQKTELPLPGFARKVLGETQHVKHEEQWNLESGEGRIRTSPRGAPVTIEAKVRMVESGDGTRLEMDWQVDAKLPLIGGKIEKLAAEEIRSRMSKDAELTNRLIAERPARA